MQDYHWFLEDERKASRLSPMPYVPLSALSFMKVGANPPDRAAPNPSLHWGHKSAQGLVGDSSYHWYSLNHLLQRKPPAKSVQGHQWGPALREWDAGSGHLSLGSVVRNVTFHEYLG